MEDYTRGNEFYKDGQFAEAAASYSAALHSREVAADSRTKILLNRAQCYLRTEQFQEAVGDCTHAISLGENENGAEQLKMKALLRRATAYEHLGDFGKALADVEGALQGNPPSSLRTTAIASRSRLKSLVVLDRSVAAEEGRPPTMVTDSQALRLGFMQEPPSVFTIGTPYVVRLCITNELGLWNRSLLQLGSDGHGPRKPKLKCSLVLSWLGASADSSEYQLAVRMKPRAQCTGWKKRDGSLRVGEDGKVRRTSTTVIFELLMTFCVHRWTSKCA
jgi:tetratricopeptide (TPR) repeat protein